MLTAKLKLDKENSAIKQELETISEIDNLDDVDVYSVIVSVEYNKLFKSLDTIKAKNAIVKENYDYSTYTDNGTLYYCVLYIAVDKNDDINDVELYFEEDEEKKVVLKASSNSVKPLKNDEENIATYGDCLTFTLDGCRAYMLLLDINKNGALGSITLGNKKYDEVSADIKFMYMFESVPENNILQLNQLFKSYSKTSTIHAIEEYDDNPEYDEAVFVDNDRISVKSYGSDEIKLSYRYPEDSMEIEEAIDKVFDNTDIKLKMFDLVIEIINKED